MSDAIITMVRNFPRHVGDYDATLPEHVCGEEEGDEHVAFREGWYYAVTTINNRITKMQQESDDTFDAHAYWEADAEGKAAMQRAAVLCECANYTAARRGMKLEQALAIAGEGEG
jgi:hypothetical protein